MRRSMKLKFNFDLEVSWRKVLQDKYKSKEKILQGIIRQIFPNVYNVFCTATGEYLKFGHQHYFCQCNAGYVC